MNPFELKLLMSSKKSPYGVASDLKDKSLLAVFPYGRHMISFHIKLSL